MGSELGLLLATVPLMVVIVSAAVWVRSRITKLEESLPGDKDGDSFKVQFAQIATAAKQLNDADGHSRIQEIESTVEHLVTDVARVNDKAGQALGLCQELRGTQKNIVIALKAQDLYPNI